MRKIFFSLVLLVFTSINSNATSYADLINQGKIFVGMSKVQLREVTRSLSQMDEPFLPTGLQNREYFPEKQMEILTGKNRNFFFVFSNVTEKVEKYYSPGNGQLHSFHWDIGSAMSALDPKIETAINKPKEKVIEATKPKLTEEQIKISKMKPEDRHAYTCAEKFGFRKGSDKFKDCVFKIYQAELELEKLELQRELAKANAETAKAKAEAARASEERQQNLARAQAEAATMQAIAARQQAIAANTASSLQMIESGLRMMSPQQSNSVRLKTNCTYIGRDLSCF